MLLKKNLVSDHIFDVETKIGQHCLIWIDVLDFYFMLDMWKKHNKSCMKKKLLLRSRPVR